MSIANRDASLQCLANAREASKRNEIDRAIQLCEKSLRLYETDEAKTFMAALKLKQERHGQQQNQTTSAPQQRSSSERDVRKHAPFQGNYTKEQQDAALQVKNTRCYYARLNIETSCSDIEVIKRAYKKRAFQFHPDKNHAPASADAFKAINQAYECLTDEQRKAAYDRYGTEDPQSNNARGSHSSYTYHTGHEDVLTPEDILNMFFASGGGHRMPQFQRRRGRPNASHDGHAQPQQQHQHAPWFQLLMQFLPVLFLLMFSMWSGPRLDGAGRPGINSGLGEVFTLEKANGFVIQRSTPEHNLIYFVRPQFNQWYGHDRRAVARIDHLVTMAHIQKLKKLCEEEKHQRDAAITKAKRLIGDEQPAALSEAHNMKLASCDKLSEIYVR